MHDKWETLAKYYSEHCKKRPRWEANIQTNINYFYMPISCLKYTIRWTSLSSFLSPLYSLISKTARKIVEHVTYVQWEICGSLYLYQMINLIYIFIMVLKKWSGRAYLEVMHGWWHFVVSILTVLITCKSVQVLLYVFFICIVLDHTYDFKVLYRFLSSNCLHPLCARIV
jgi:hypothetical protein